MVVSGIDIRPVAMVVGSMMVVLAVFMVPPMLADLAADNDDWKSFFFAGGLTAFIGVSLILMHRNNTSGELTMRQSFLLTNAVWFITTIFASIPFFLADMSLADAYFEATSGLTTTGATVMVGLDTAAPGLLLWRALLQWLGGIGIIVMGVAILPMLRIGGMQLFRTESTDLSDKILPRAAQIASAIGIVYLVLSLGCALCYFLAGMEPFDAMIHAMTTLSSGGYSSHDASIGFFDSAAIEWIAIFFMILSGVPFVLFVQTMRGATWALWRDAQVRWYLGVLLCATLLLTSWTHYSDQLMGHDSIRHAAFTASAIMTGTGYSSLDYNAWGPFAIGVVFFLMCVGGCTGSTTGGIKMFRFAVLYSVASVQIRRLMQPNGVFRPMYNRQIVSDSTAVAVLAFIFMFALSFAGLTLILSAQGLDYLTSMSGAVTSLSNVGPGLGVSIGPAGNFASLPETAKWTLSFGMLLGRLELLTVFVLFAPSFWKR